MDEVMNDDEARLAAAAVAIAELLKRTNPTNANRNDSRLDCYICDQIETLENIYSKVLTGIYNAASIESNQEFFHLRPIRQPIAVFEDIVKDKEIEPTVISNLHESQLSSGNHQDPSLQESTNLIQLDKGLNEMQPSILEECKSYFSKVALCKATNNKMPTPLKILVFGGPGTGESFLTNGICKVAKKRDLYVGCCAATGIAATNMPEGRTIHNSLGISNAGNFWNWNDLP